VDGLNDIKVNFEEFASQINKPDTWIQSDLGTTPENFSKENLNVRPSGAMKNDAGKPRFSLLPINPLFDAIDVLEAGSKRYGDHNWEKGFPWLDLFNATQRHLMAWRSGEDLASDSLQNHLAHAMVNIMFLLEFTRTHPELDNRLRK
jgi:Domain of unknown function (DUF5664)